MIWGKIVNFKRVQTPASNRFSIVETLCTKQSIERSAVHFQANSKVFPWLNGNTVYSTCSGSPGSLFNWDVPDQTLRRIVFRCRVAVALLLNL